MEKWELNDDSFGVLLPYVKDKNVTDIHWDGTNLWIDDLFKGKYCLDIKLDEAFINRFTQRIGDLTNSNFSPSVPVLEGETDSLRIACLHESRTATGTAITIRKTEAECRLTDGEMIKSNYCDEKMLKLLHSLVAARSSFIVTGDTGSGKTELIKYLIQSIPDKVTTLTVEDTFEIRAKATRPRFDCIEIKVDDDVFTPKLAIKAALRQNAKYLILSEARSKEALNLIEAASTGCTAMTTVHTLDVRNIPDRFDKMIGVTTRDIVNDVHAYFDVGVLIIKKETPKGIVRNIGQVCLFDRTQDGNKTYMIYDNGKYNCQNFPDKLRKKFSLYDVEIPEFLVNEG